MRDEHCHIIYGVDDGSHDYRETMHMLSAAAQAGIADIVCTPHMRWDNFSQPLVQQRFDEVREMARLRGVHMALGYEVYYKTLIKIGLEQAPRFVEEGTNNILIEFNTGGSCVQGWERAFDQLQSRYGLDITVAHPERYSTVWENFDTVYKMKDMGCRLEVSAADLFARHKDMARAAKRLMAEGLCDAVVSDAHRPEHYQLYARAVRLYR